MFFCEGIRSQEGTRDDAGRNRQPPRRKALGRDRTRDLLIVRQGCEPAATPAASRLYRENLLCLRKVCCVPKCCTSFENSRSPPHLGDQAVAPGLFHIYQTSHAVVSGTHRRNEKQRRVERAFLLFFWSANPGTAPWLWTLLPRGCELSWPRARAHDTDKYECACSTTWPRRMVAWQGSKVTTVSENVLSRPGTRVSRGEGEPGIWQFSSSVHLKLWRLRNILVFFSFKDTESHWNAKRNNPYSIVLVQMMRDCAQPAATTLEMMKLELLTVWVLSDQEGTGSARMLQSL